MFAQKNNFYFEFIETFPFHKNIIFHTSYHSNDLLPKIQSLKYGNKAKPSYLSRKLPTINAR